MNTTINHLVSINAEKKQEILAIKNRIDEQRSNEPTVGKQQYPLIQLQTQIIRLIEAGLKEEDLGVSFDLLERKKFKADIAVRVTGLLKRGGSKDYMRIHLPKILELLQADASLSNCTVSIITRGIYINILLTDDFLLKSLSAIQNLKNDFGKNNALAERTFIVDYSSPNVAKRLHAGHIRSTIIGHVLLNFYRACGAKAYGVNHINDFGGFGFYLAGYRRWNDKFDADVSANERLLQLYSIRRTSERLIQKTSIDECTTEERALINRFYGEINSIEALKKEFDAYILESDLAFRDLGKGKKEQIELWKKMVKWSMEDFSNFYAALDINIDLTIGESFYFLKALELIETAKENGIAKWFTEELAAKFKDQLTQKLKADALTEQEYESLIEQINKDIGALIIPLPEEKRLVILRSDGLSIYSTRDIGAIYLRKEIFNFTDGIYVVGQEQGEHFSRLFAASKELGYTNDSDNLLHVYFGFYIDAITKKKLSSRDGISNVYNFLSFSNDYFERKYREEGKLASEEIKTIAKELSLGSLVFNDLRKDMKSAVDIAGDDLEKTIANFEKSGGIYVVYAMCRAKSIVVKVGTDIPDVTTLKTTELTSMEAQLILGIQSTPLIIEKAAITNNPAVLARHTLSLASNYNTYYAQSRVIDNNILNSHRLVITEAFRQNIENCLKLMHIPCPKYI